jgi:disulfide bond formation protein DsbB
MLKASARKPLRLAARLLLVFALLVARGGAITHAYAHLANDPPSVPTQTCEQCLSFAPMQSLAGGSVEPILIEQRQSRADIVRVTFSVACVSRPSPFQCRAPPVLL